MPNSPVFLVINGREREAEKVLKMLGYGETALQDIQESLAKTNQGTSRWEIITSIFTERHNRTPFIYGMVLMTFFQVSQPWKLFSVFSGNKLFLALSGNFQCTAYPVLIGRVNDLLKDSGSLLSETVQSVILGTVLVTAASVSIILSKKCKRRTLLITSALGVSMSLFGLGVFYYLKQMGLTDGLGWLPILTFVIYICFFMVINHFSTTYASMIIMNLKNYRKMFSVTTIKW